MADTEARRTTAGGHHGPCLTCKQHPSSDHTRKDPSEDRNGHCRRTGGIITKKGDKRSNHEYQLMHKAREHQQQLYRPMCFVDFKKAFDKRV